MVMLAWALALFVGAASVANAGSSGCYWEESKRSGNESFRTCIVWGLVGAGIGFSVLYSFLLMYCAPGFVSWLVRSVSGTRANSEKAMAAFLRFRDTRVVPWLVFFAAIPVVYRLWFVCKARGWEKAQIMNALDFADDALYYSQGYVPRQRTPFQPASRIMPTGARTASGGDWIFSGSGGGGGSFDLFDDEDGIKVVVIIVVAIIVLLSISLGFLTAWRIVRWADERYDAYRKMEGKTPAKEVG